MRALAVWEVAVVGCGIMWLVFFAYAFGRRAGARKERALVVQQYKENVKGIMRGMRAVRASDANLASQKKLPTIMDMGA